MTLVLARAARQAVSAADAQNAAAQAADIAMVHLAEEFEKPADEDSCSTEQLVAATCHLRDLDFSALDLSVIHLDRELATIEDYVVATVGALEKFLHGEWSPDRKTRSESGECLCCDRVIRLFIKILMDLFGVRRASGFQLPSPGFYCRRNPKLLKKLLHATWPGIRTASAPISRARRMNRWEVDPAAMKLLNEIDREVLRRPRHLTRSVGQLRRSVRLAVRRVLRQRRRVGDVATLDIASLGRHPFGWAFEKEDWPSYVALSLDLQDDPCGMEGWLNSGSADQTANRFMSLIANLFVMLLLRLPEKLAIRPGPIDRH